VSAPVAAVTEEVVLEAVPDIVTREVVRGCIVVALDVVVPGLLLHPVKDAVTINKAKTNEMNLLAFFNIIIPPNFYSMSEHVSLI
jgi:hypothetical protein